jgi:uncharacterized protein (DUF697 family)
MEAITEKEILEESETGTETVRENDQKTLGGCEGAVCTPERGKVEKAIRESVYASMGVGIVPIPFFNIAAVTASNLNLACKLSKLYGVEFKENIAKNIIASITGASAGVFASPFVETAVIGLPLVGLPLAVGTKSILNGMTTYALGQMFVTHFERGGNFLAANADAMKEDFKAAYKNSREWLGDIVSGKKKAETTSA